MCYWYKANEEMMVSEMQGLVGIDGKGEKPIRNDSGASFQITIRFPKV